VKDYHTLISNTSCTLLAGCAAAGGDGGAADRGRWKILRQGGEASSERRCAIQRQRDEAAVRRDGVEVEHTTSGCLITPVWANSQIGRRAYVHLISRR